MKYRLYIDEVGNADLGASVQNPNHRYLRLTGIIMELDYVNDTAFPAIEELKRRYFGSHADEPIILHRKELVNKKPPFHALRDPEMERRFNGDLMTLLGTLDYVVVTAVIDKFEHQERYTVWRHDPYHYCLEVLVERYVGWLERQDATGDVMAESRGGGEDRRLKRAFTTLFEEGSAYIESAKFAERLTSRQLKLKVKATNISGLQLADLIAHPSYRAVLARQQNQALPANFGGQVARLLEERKYDRSPAGEIRGWGQEWLP